MVNISKLGLNYRQANRQGPGKVVHVRRCASRPHAERDHLASQLTRLQHSILRQLFIKAGTALTARAISLALNVSQPAVSKALPRLQKEELVLVAKDRATKRLAIQLNRENPLAIGLKRADNLKQIYESGLSQFVQDNLAGSVVILFGSYSHGEDATASDIDLAVIGLKEKELDLAEFEKRLGREIIMNFYESFGRIDKPLLGNVLSGIVLKGAVELQ
ncbi:MAG: MarR family transcriptional regulator [archaeon]